MKIEETEILLEECSEISSFSKLEKEMEELYLPQNRNELLSILIRS